MDSTIIAGRIDHTLLKAYASWKDIEALCEEACAYHTASVCIPPNYIKRVKEVDMGINICDVKNGDYASVKDEIASIKSICGAHILKVIIETCYLTEEEKIKMCEIVTEAGADYIKTSTGFGTGGATFEDVKLFKEHIGENVKIKAAGGIRTAEDMRKYIELGCDRLGCSSTSVLFE